MPKRWNGIFKGICGLFLLLILLQLSGLIAGKDPLKDVDMEYYRELAGDLKGAEPNSNGRKKPELPDAIRVQVERIQSSAVFGMQPKPPPYVLEGFAGDYVLIQVNGKSEQLKAGEEAGGVKILRIDNNRVLIEHENQEKELNIFEGLGSQPLSSAGKENR